MKKVCLLTGSPGTGKTTIIKEALARTKVSAGGFYTEEIRLGGVRQGFKLISLDGQDAILAHINISSPHRVGKYGVDVDGLDRVGVSALNKAVREGDLVVIDEIGKMELFSANFRRAVLEAIESGKKVLGTIMYRPHPWADEIKRHPKVKVLVVTRANHNQVLEEIQGWLRHEDNA